MERGLKMKKIDLEIDRGIQTAIENQHREFLKKEIERKKREQKKERVISIFIGIFIVVLVGMVLHLNSKLTTKYIDSCIEAGHDRAYCIKKS